MDLSLIKDAAWELATRRAEVIRPLAALPRCPYALVADAAVELGLSVRQTYTLVKRCRAGEGATTSLVLGASHGGRGSPRIADDREAVIRNVICELFLTSQRLSPEAVVREVRRRCHAAGLKPPSGNTVRRRLQALTPEDRGKRGEPSASRTAVSGRTPPAARPLAAVQVDHTKVDIILVDPVNRKPIGRPWLIVAIDVYSRCIAGMHLSLEPPSATSVGLCLVHIASDKARWLAERGVSGEWPIQGKPESIGVDNGAEFHSAAFERGCEQYGIAIRWRPPGQPQFGGIVERVIGSLMKLVHELPGTTFSNPVERGEYDSDRTACLTLEELEHWLAVAITGVYHQRPHAGLGGESPLARYRVGVRDTSPPPVISNPHAFLIDFLPVIRRTLQRNGITIDRITYFSSALKPWIARINVSPSVLVRRDPRDLSRIYLYVPETGGYLEVPYRDLSRPAITLWEHRLALRRLREHHRAVIDETALFQAVTELRAIERAAVVATRTARRNSARRHTPVAIPSTTTPAQKPQAVEGALTPPPFTEIESW